MCTGAYGTVRPVVTCTSYRGNCDDAIKGSGELCNSIYTVLSQIIDHIYAVICAEYVYCAVYVIGENGCSFVLPGDRPER